MPRGRTPNNEYDIAMSKAIYAVLFDGITANEAAKQFSVPYTSLFDRVKRERLKNQDLAVSNRRRKPLVSEETEKEIRRLVECAGRYLSLRELVKMVKVHLGVEITVYWAKYFYDRNPDLKEEEKKERRLPECRACRVEGYEGMISFGEDEQMREFYAQLIGFKVEDTSQFLCLTCRDQLFSFVEFKEMCLASESRLAEIKDEEDSNFVLPLEVKEEAPPKVAPAKKVEPVLDRVTCNDCGLIFAHKGLLLIHWRYEHAVDEAPLVCPECGEETVNVYLMERHRMDAHGVLMCPHCERMDLVVSGPDAVKKHKYHMHRCKKDAEEKSYACSRCSKRYTTQKRMKTHEEKCQGPTKLCETCGKDILLKRWTLHAESHVLNGFPCRAGCGKTFRSKIARGRHEMNHAPEEQKIFSCSECNLRFPARWMVTGHIRQKHGQKKERKKYKCTVCGKKVAALVLHMRLHTDDRPYKCVEPNCSMSFRNKLTLEKHKFSHSKQRPYNCTLCTRGYYQTQYLRKHMRRVHGHIYVDGAAVPYRKPNDLKQS